MKTFAEFQSEWDLMCQRDPEMIGLIKDKLQPLLTNIDEEFIQQGMELLLQFDGLVFILEEVENTICVSKQYRHHSQIVEMIVIEAVFQAGSEWCGLVEQGSFDEMWHRIFEQSDYSTLSWELQEVLLKKVHQMVALPENDCSIGKYLVTQALWEQVMGSNPSKKKGGSRPVENVSWFDCIDFCNRLNEREGLEQVYYTFNNTVTCDFTANGYRLPTNWEWWYAAKAEQEFVYAGSDNIDEVAWYSGNSDRRIHGVGQKKPNGFGLYDMSGNVDECCWDWYTGEALVEGETGPLTGTVRVLRGGGWRGGANGARIDSCRWGKPTGRFNDQGFRLARTLSEDKH